MITKNDCEQCKRYCASPPLCFDYPDFWKPDGTFDIDKARRMCGKQDK